MKTFKSFRLEPRLTNTSTKFFLLISLLIVLWLFSNSFNFLNLSFKQSDTSQNNLQINNVPYVTSSALPTSTPAPKKPETKTSIPQVSGNQVKVPVLMYHYIGGNPNPADVARDALSVSPERFDEQMRYLKSNGFNVITLDTLYAAISGQISLPDKSVVITFDDGYIDLFLNAYPILLKHQLRAVAFIPTGLIGTSYYASWDQLSQMQASGLFSFQSHSVTHANLASLSKEQLMYELTESKRVLEARFGIPVNSIAYPYGTSSPLVWTTTRNAGYVGGLGTWYSLIQSEGTRYNMPRIKVSGGWDINSFASKLH